MSKLFEDAPKLLQEVNSRRKGVANDEIRTNFNAAAII